MTEGYLFCVGGEDLYYKLLRRAIETLRKFDPIRPICIVTEDVDRAKLYCNFENIDYKKFELEKHLVETVDPNVPWHRYGFYPKVFQFHYTPFDTTMFFDVDYVFTSDFTYFWKKFSETNETIWISGMSDQNNISPRDWHWGWIYTVIQRSGIAIPHVMSSFMIYRKEFKIPYMQFCNFILMNMKNWGCLRNFREGYPDEIFLAILIGILKIHPNREMFDWLTDGTKVLSCDKNLE